MTSNKTIYTVNQKNSTIWKIKQNKKTMNILVIKVKRVSNKNVYEPYYRYILKNVNNEWEKVKIFYYYKNNGEIKCFEVLHFSDKKKLC